MDQIPLDLPVYLRISHLRLLECCSISDPVKSRCQVFHSRLSPRNHVGALVIIDFGLLCVTQGKK